MNESMQSPEPAKRGAVVNGLHRGPRRGELEEGMLEVMTHLSPDGRPPHLSSERRIARVFVVLGVVIFGVVLGLLLLIGGRDAGALTLVYLPILLVAAFPVWLSAMFRKREEKHAATMARTVVRGLNERKLVPEDGREVE